MVKLKIKITKEVLKKTRKCPKGAEYENCAIAAVIRDIWPKAFVDNLIQPFGRCSPFETCIELPTIAVRFIIDFDNSTPRERRRMPEVEFEIEVPDAVIERINIEELRPILQNHRGLQLIENQ